MNVGDMLHGFRLLSVTPVEELDAKLNLFEHEKSGAGLVWLEREDENKTFSVAFKTLPEDDTGVFHILEHSVLCGSDKYHVKEPFVELLKSSMSTFLNAMTFPDKTMYPVSSRNDRDLRNLMGVYLDAVFKPDIYINESIFMQEGHRFDGEEEGKKPEYVGVVFNEMKGAMSSMDGVAEEEVTRLLFPDTPYQFNSGGDPVAIPKLTYEQFKANHAKYYHPSNSYFFLDGSIDLDGAMSDIDAYLAAYDRQEVHFDIPLQQPIAPTEAEAPYEIGAEEDGAQKHALLLGRVLGRYDEQEKNVAAKLLCDYLTGHNDAPLTRAILSSGLAQDVSTTVETGMQQSYFVTELQNMPEDRVADAYDEIRAIIEKILSDGIDEEELQAALNVMEFKSHEVKEPRGIYLAIATLDSWLYGGDPAMCLKNNEVFAAVRAKIGTPYFAELMKEMFLKNEGRLLLHMVPSKTLGEEKHEREIAAAHAEWDALPETEKETYRRKLEKLHAWQQNPDAPEEVRKIPTLALSDVEETAPFTDVTEETIDGVRVIRTPVNASGTVYLETYFDLAPLEVSQIPVAAFLCLMLGDMATEHYDVVRLNQLIKRDLGDLDFSFDVAPVLGKRDQCVPRIRVSCAVLESKVEAAIELIREICLTSKLNDAEKLREALQQQVISSQQGLQMAGHVFAMLRSTASISASGYAGELTRGYTGLKTAEGWQAAWDTVKDQLIADMEAMTKKAFVRNRMTIGITGGMTNEAVRQLIAAFPEGEAAADGCIMQMQLPAAAREAAVIPAAISFAGTSAHMEDIGGSFTGKWQVFTHIVSLMYLWAEVRVKGGAYGCGVRAGRNGVITYYSYRDPKAPNSLKVFNKTSDFMRGYCAAAESLDTMIIGAIAGLEPLQSPKAKGALAISRRLSGITHEMLNQERTEMLSCTTQDLLDICAVLDKLEDKCAQAVFGGEAILNECEGLTRI